MAKDLEIKELKWLSGEMVDCYINCNQGVIENVYFQTNDSAASVDLYTKLIKIFEGVSIEDLYSDSFIKRLSFEFIPKSCESIDIGVNMSERILHAYFNKYYT
ncbi:hypothetical protein NYE24_05860 [Paenibacillus sp. FSL H7-0350]|uniref:hypothetical protein n=1 Tax=Paenibacillus sp. FSL H7-0350 TaxID=2975345 RepID=UPI003159792C